MILSMQIKYKKRIVIYNTTLNSKANDKNYLKCKQANEILMLINKFKNENKN